MCIIPETPVKEKNHDRYKAFTHAAFPHDGAARLLRPSRRACPVRHL